METIKPFKCAVCEQWKGVAHLAESYMFETAGEYYHLCNSCDEDRSRKFDSGLAQVAYVLSMDGMEDDRMGGAYGEDDLTMIGNVILSSDSQGFVYATDYDSPEAVQKEWERLYSEGYGYCEDDAIVEQDGDGWSWILGRTSGLADTLAEALLEIEEEMERQGFYPSVWRQGYDLQLVDIALELRDEIMARFDVKTDEGMPIETYANLLREMIAKEEETAND